MLDALEAAASLGATCYQLLLKLERTSVSITQWGRRGGRGGDARDLESHDLRPYQIWNAPPSVQTALHCRAATLSASSA